jgi:hypothetical protein
MARLLLIPFLALWPLAAPADPPTLEEQLADYHDDCLASLKAMDYGSWYARRICNCATEHLEETIRAAAEEEPQATPDVPPVPTPPPNCL